MLHCVLSYKICIDILIYKLKKITRVYVYVLLLINAPSLTKKYFTKANKCDYSLGASFPISVYIYQRAEVRVNACFCCLYEIN